MQKRFQYYPDLTWDLILGSHLSIRARLAQSVEHGTLNPRVVGSSPTLGERIFVSFSIFEVSNKLNNRPVCS